MFLHDFFISTSNTAPAMTAFENELQCGYIIEITSFFSQAVFGHGSLLQTLVTDIGIKEYAFM